MISRGGGGGGGGGGGRFFPPTPASPPGRAGRREREGRERGGRERAGRGTGRGGQYEAQDPSSYSLLRGVEESGRDEEEDEDDSSSEDILAPIPILRRGSNPFSSSDSINMLPANAVEALPTATHIDVRAPQRNVFPTATGRGLPSFEIELNAHGQSYPSGHSHV